MPGTWGDAIIIQAVADQLQLKLIIAETHERFQAYNVVQPVLSTQQLTNVYLGHIDEYHYVSTLPGSFLSGFSNNEVNSEQTLDTGKINITENTSNRNDETISPNHLTDIQRTIQLLEECFNVKHASESLHHSTHCPESKDENRKKYVSEYSKQKRASESFQPCTMSPESKQKRKKYIKEYRQQKRASEHFQPSL